MNYLKRFFLALLILIPIYFVLYKIYIPRVNAFGCFDDCFNIAAGYFINKGKVLYSEIFFNHQMLPAYISSLIQAISNPTNLFELILRHRQFVMLFGFSMNLLIIYRFGIAGLGFIFVYEFSKFYLFGDRFLAEGLIVYPLVYLMGLTLNKVQNKIIHPIEYIMCAIFSWFVVFMREPYTLLALLMYFFVLYSKRISKNQFISFITFIFLTTATILSTPIKEYVFNLITANKEAFYTSQINFSDLVKIFFYPIYILFTGELNLFRQLLIVIDLTFLGSIARLLYQKKYKMVLVISVLLGLANLRAVVPGRIFYDAFHLLPWYSLFIFITFSLIANQKYAKPALGFLAILFLFLILSPSYFAREKANPHEEFITNYGNYLQTGEVVKKLAQPSDTLFLDGYDEIIYWQTGLVSPYKYSWYTSFMPRFKKYSDERLLMFKNSPPNFYYGSCPEDKNLFRQLPLDAYKSYQRLYSFGKPTCLFVRKDKIPQISKLQWEKAKEFNYGL